MSFQLPDPPRVVIVVPWRSDHGGRRDVLWAYTRAWLEGHHPELPIIQADSDPGPFNRGQAINRAAEAAGDWDVMVIHDADNITDPLMLNGAVFHAMETEQATLPYEVYCYLDERSTHALMTQGNFFFSPIRYDDQLGPYDGRSMIYHHCSGAMAVPRIAWDKIGGFFEMRGWGFEDTITAALFEDFGGGLQWMTGSALHLWHDWDRGSERVRMANYDENEKVNGPNGLRTRRRRFREYLASVGHPIPTPGTDQMSNP